MTTTNIYIRPGDDVPGGAATYGTGDGSSYANAFSGLQDAGIDWSVRDLQVWVCGVHAPIHDVAVSTNIAKFFLSPVTGGTARQPTIIRGDYPGDPGRIWGGYFFSLGSWSVQDAPTSTYQLTLPGATEFSWWLKDGWLFDVGTSGDGIDRLVRVDSIAEVQSTPGSYYKTGDTQGSIVYVRLSDDGDPSANHRVLLPRRGHQIYFTGISHLTFYKMDLFPTTEYELFNKGIQFRRCRVFYGSSNDNGGGQEGSDGGRIMIGNKAKKVDDITISRCELGRCTVGAVYTTWVRPIEGVAQPQPANWYITHNRIDEVGDLTWNNGTDMDDHTIGFQNIDGMFVYGNVCSNAGPGIVGFAAGASNPDEFMRNCSIRRNVSRDGRNDPHFFAPTMLQLDMSDGVCDCTGNEMVFNVARGLAAGGTDPVTLPGCGYKIGDKNLNNIPVFENNVAEDVPDGIFTNAEFQYVTVRNFTCIAPTFTHVRFRFSNTIVDIDNSTYSGGPGGDEFYRGVGYTWSEWQTAGYDAGSSHSA